MIDIDNPREEDLSRWQRLQLSRFNLVYIGKYRKPGWSGEIEHYLFRCKKHGIVCDYPHSHKQVISCPKCFKEGLNEETNDSRLK